MHAHKRTALIGDISGTHARFAICDIDELSVAHFAVFQTSMFSSLPEAAAHYLESVPVRPDIAGFSVAAPLDGDTITMTNCPWTFTSEAVRAATGASHIYFLNNLEALAQALPYLNAHDRCELGGGKPLANAPMIAIGTGSGFGCAALVRTGEAWMPVAGEGGNVAFAACDERELAVLSRISDADGYAPLRSVLTGRGMTAIHRALAELDGLSAPDVASVDIIRAASEDEDERALATLDCFTSILARVAGDMALLYGARGGVYIGGGITQKILKMLQEERFRKRFENKGEMSAYLTRIPVYAILATDAGLRGAAFAVSERFPMDPIV